VIALRILRYLSRNADARDTLEGIRNWWIAPDGSRWSRATVRDVLEDLVARGLLTARGGASEARIYGLSSTRAGEIRKAMAELEREQ
jgi:hypothetical protein